MSRVVAGPIGYINLRRRYRPPRKSHSQAHHGCDTDKDGPKQSRNAGNMSGKMASRIAMPTGRGAKDEHPPADTFVPHLIAAEEAPNLAHHAGAIDNDAKDAPARR